MTINPLSLCDHRWPDVTWHLCEVCTIPQASFINFCLFPVYLFLFISGKMPYALEQMFVAYLSNNNSYTSPVCLSVKAVLWLSWTRSWARNWVMKFWRTWGSRAARVLSSQPLMVLLSCGVPADTSPSDLVILLWHATLIWSWHVQARIIFLLSTHVWSTQTWQVEDIKWQAVKREWELDVLPTLQRIHATEAWSAIGFNGVRLSSSHISYTFTLLRFRHTMSNKDGPMASNKNASHWVTLAAAISTYSNNSRSFYLQSKLSILKIHWWRCRQNMINNFFY